MTALRRSLLVLLMLALVASAWWSPLDRAATEQVDAGLKRALVSFATARALNAVISVAQGTEISVQPMGVGATFAPGQLLDPVNDLVEHFSNLMLAASVAFGVQKVLINVGGYWPISLTLAVVALGWTWLRLRRQRPAPWLGRLLVILVLLRFAVPVVVIGTDRVWQEFLADEYRSSQQVIAATSTDAAGRDPTLPIDPASQGLADKLKGWFSHTTDVKARFDELKLVVEQATEHMIRLIVVFLLQTLVIPVLLLWLVWVWTRSLIEPTRE